MELANRLMNQAPLEEKNMVRANLQKRMDPQSISVYTQRGQDPLIVFYRNQALNRLREEKRQRIAQAQHMAMSQPGQNAAPPIAHQRSMNPSPLNGQTQPPTSMGGNPEFGGFLGNMDSIANQQQQGVIAQGQGEVVVPANGAQRNPTPQPGPGQQVVNPNNRTARQQHMLNVQQMQQQRSHAAQQQQQQQQNQARLNSQSKAQQIGLQGQPGGMGNGPMPPQQSPAMPTLNTPLRTPSQMGHAEPPQANPNPAFGQPLDPRFATGNQRPAGPGNAMNTAGLNPAMFAGMTQQQQQDIVSLPPDKLNEVMNKWNEQRTQMNAANMQAGRPPGQMQGNNQARPGQQVPQQGPFNPQNPNQFALNGQRPPQGPPMSAAMTPQQQILLQAQIARLQNPQRNGPPMGLPNEQRLIAQMDSLDFPTTLLNHNSMPRGIPPEVKKWGPLKAWAQQNPNMGAEVFENIKNLQRMHWQQLMRARTAQAGQPGPMQPGGQGPQATMPAIPPGMNAPVAPMGHTPMQLPNGMPGPGQIRQPTQQEIENLRNHPSGRMMHQDDNTIRMFLMRQAAGRQQQAANMQMQNQQMQNQMSQINGPRPGQPQPNPNARGPNQAPPAQAPGPKQPPAPQPAASTANAPNANRAARPSARSAARNSSPAQPAKNLKRASSDDVVEVPNPNPPQNARSAPQQAQDQQAQAQKQPPQQQFRQLNPAAVAALDPESRKKYEQGLKMARDKAQLEKFRSIAHEEQQNTQPAADIPMDPATKANVTKMLRDILQPLSNMSRAVPRWYQITGDETRARSFFRLVSRKLSKLHISTNANTF
jgi:hypothetical protein